MRFATRRPLMVLVGLMAASMASAVSIAIKYSFPPWTALGASYGALALGQIAYLILAIVAGPDEARAGGLADQVRAR